MLRLSQDRVSLEWLCAQDPGTRREVLEELAERRRDEDIEVLIASLRDENPGVQQAAVSGLIRVGAPPRRAPARASRHPEHGRRNH